MHNNPTFKVPTGGYQHYQEPTPSSLPLVASIFYHIAMIIFGIITLIISIIGYSQLNAYNNAVKDFRTNWEYLPIVDIQTSLAGCPLGYDELLDRQWPGTSSGCDCSNMYMFSFKKYPSLSSGSCSSNQTEAGWTDIRSTNPIPLSKFYSYRICGLREGSNFVDSKRPKTQGGKLKCELGYRICGKGDADHVLCIRKQERCPINHITLLESGMHADPSYKTVPLDAGVSVKIFIE